MKIAAPTPKPKPAAFERFMAMHKVSLQEARANVKLFWYCRTDDGWQYLHDSPDVRKRHPSVYKLFGDGDRRAA